MDKRKTDREEKDKKQQEQELKEHIELEFQERKFMLELLQKLVSKN